MIVTLYLVSKRFAYGKRNIFPKAGSLRTARMFNYKQD